MGAKKRHFILQPIHTDYRYIPLTQGQNAIVDAADFDWLSQWHWHAHWCESTKSFYARRNENKRTILMSRQILSCTRNELADHENHDTLDHRRSNLRKADRFQNAANVRARKDNTTGMCGVYWNKQNRKWSAQVGHRGEYLHLGYFSSQEDAARVRDEAAKKYHGEFARLNFAT